MIVSYILLTIGYCIEIYYLFRYGDDKHTNVCLWTTNGMGFILALMYCYENQYFYLMYFFIFHTVLCFICLSINCYYALITKEDTQTFIVQETMPQLHETYKEKNVFDIEKGEQKMISNPLHTKYSFKKKSQLF
jgi:hypothetical protein